MIDVIKDVFNVEKLDGAMRDFGDFELTLLKVSKNRNYFKDKEDHFQKNQFNFLKQKNDPN